MSFRNFKMVDYVVYGRGIFNQLDEILAPNRKGGAPMIFLVDHFFEGKPLVQEFHLLEKIKLFLQTLPMSPKPVR